MDDIGWKFVLILPIKMHNDDEIDDKVGERILVVNNKPT